MRDPWIFVSTELGGETWGKCVEVAMARGAFWNMLIAGKLAVPLLNSWGMRTGICPTAASVGWLRRILADRPGFSDIAVSMTSENPGFLSDKLRAADERPDAEPAEGLPELLEFLAGERIEIETSQISTDALLVALAKGMDAVRTAFDELGDVLPEAQAFVESINCPWPWLAALMVNHFRRRIETCVNGQDPEITLIVKQPPRREKIPPFTIQPTPDESIPEFFKRFDHASTIYRQQVKALEEENMPQGVVPGQARLRIIERHVMWFYLHHVHEYRFSIRFIAEESTSTTLKPPRCKDGRPDRHTIRDGIQKAKYLLELSP